MKIKQCVVLYVMVFTGKSKLFNHLASISGKKKKRFEKARTSIRKRGGGEAGDISFAHVKMQI